MEAAAGRMKALPSTTGRTMGPAPQPAILGAVVVYRRGRSGGWRLVRAPKTPQPLAAVRLALGDDDVITWTPENGRGSPVFLARDSCALEAFRAAPPAPPA